MSSQTFISSDGPIAIPVDSMTEKANPYPSEIMVSGVNKPVTQIQVQLNDLTHTYPGDIDMLLVAPNGTTPNLILMSRCGANISIMNITLTLDDTAQDFMSFSDLTTGTFKPTDYNQGMSSFPAPAPSTPPPYGVPGPTGSATIMNTFGNLPDFNGTWKLFIVDDFPQSDDGTLISWQLTFFFAAQPCLYKNTWIQLKSGKKRIKDIKAGDHVIDSAGNAVKVEYNIVLPAANNFILIPKDTLGENQPSNELLIRKGHPLLIDGKEVLPETLMKIYPNVRKVKAKKDSIYSLCTKDRIFVKMNNLNVATWAKNAWESRTDVIYKKQ